MLEETLVIGESTGVILGSVGGVVANGEGTIFVADPENAHIRVFSPSGDSLTTIGRKGQGPGEFQTIAQLHLGRGDSLIAYDQRARELSFFDPQSPYTFRRAVEIPHPSGAFVRQMFVPDTSGLYVVYFAPLSVAEDGQHTPDEWLAWLDPSGNVVRDSILTVAAQPGIVRVSESPRLFYSLPFGKEAAFTLGPDGSIIHGRTDSLRLSTYRADGERISTVRLPYEPIPVSDDDIDSVTTGMSGQAKDLMNQAEFPDFHPAFRELVTDDRDRVWIDVIDRPSSDTTSWKIVDLSAQEVIDTRLPEKVSIRYIRDGRVYGVREDENGLDEVVVYEIRNV